MKARFATIFATMIAAQLGCRATEPTAPDATEPFPVTIVTRVAAEGEAIPAIHASASAGSLTVRVTRRAMCMTEIRAAVSRGRRQVNIVSHVSSNYPEALCARIQANAVVDYSGTVSSLAPGAYLVRVFEGEGDGTPEFLGSVAVSLPGS